MSDANFRFNIHNNAPWPVFLTVGPNANGFSSCITMGDGTGAQFGDTRYMAPGASLQLFFWRSSDCHGEQGWLALRAAYNPYSVQVDGAYQQFWFSADGGLEKQGKEASYPNTIAGPSWDGDTAIYDWAFTDAADWPAGYSRTPLENPIALAYTNSFEFIWDDTGSGAIFDGSVWQPTLDGFFNMGYAVFGPHENAPADGIASRAALMVKPLQPGVVVPPNSYVLFGTDKGSGADNDGSWWWAVAPDGFNALGPVFVRGYAPPSRDAIVCLRNDLVATGESGKMRYADRGSGARDDIEAFQIVPQAMGTVGVGAAAVSTSYILGSPPKLPGVALCPVLKPPAKADMSDGLSAADVEAIIAASGPLLLLHPAETWMPISADLFIEASTRVENYLIVTDPNVLRGDLSTAKAYVFAEYVCSQFTDLQFWFFYGYNGATFVQVQLWVASGSTYLWGNDQNADNLNCGQHTGDWENITLRVDNTTKQVVAVGYTSHGDTEWSIAQPGQVKSYSALHMHGSYPTAGDVYELASWQEKDLTVATLEVEVYSRNICADGGESLDCSQRYQIVHSNFLPGVATPAWLGPAYQGVFWGQKEPREDNITINGVPVIGSYTYNYTTDDSGPSTPTFRVS